MKCFRRYPPVIIRISVICNDVSAFHFARKTSSFVLLNTVSFIHCLFKDVKSQLAAVTYFVYIGPGREVVKQDHPPQAMYFILSGEAGVTVRQYDKLLQEWVEKDAGTIGPGTMFGEVALIHGIVRLATITTLSKNQQISSSLIAKHFVKYV